MDRITFDKALNTLLFFKQVSIDERMSNSFYNLMFRDFTNEEFNEICGRICKEDDLFGKYPDPKMFYSKKKKDEVLIEVGSFYLDNTMPEYKPYMIGLSDDDIENVWNYIIKKNRGKFVEKKYIIETLIRMNRNIKQEELPNFSDVKKMIEERKNERN